MALGRKSEAYGIGMWIRRLQLEGIRNLQGCDLECDSGLNLVVGPNGAGKTSFLEGIYFLHRGSTFRGRKSGSMRREGSERCFVCAWGRQTSGRETRGCRSCEPGESGGPGARAGLGGLTARLVSDSVYLLVEGAPELRRRFVDWNLFNLEPRYGELVRDYRRTANQRNAWLKAGARGPAIWDEPYVVLSKRIDEKRKAYVEALQRKVQASWDDFSLLKERLRLAWVTGFDPENLVRDLKRMLETDRRRGFTYYGPERGDLRIEKGNGVRLGSRGEDKVVAVLLQIGASRLGDEAGAQDIWLVDDIGSELSGDNAKRLVEMVVDSGAQVFLTALQKNWANPGRVFHVEQGLFRAG